jgi:hypothetical protein
MRRTRSCCLRCASILAIAGAALANPYAAPPAVRVALTPGCQMGYVDHIILGCLNLLLQNNVVKSANTTGGAVQQEQQRQRHRPRRQRRDGVEKQRRRGRCGVRADQSRQGPHEVEHGAHHPHRRVGEAQQYSFQIILVRGGFSLPFPT